MDDWTSKLNTIMFPDDTNLDEAAQDTTTAKNHDIGMINGKSGAGILARETGVLEGFSYYNLGFRMDPATMTFSIFAPKIQMFCSDYKVYDAATKEDFNRINEDYSEILNMIGGKVDAKV